MNHRDAFAACHPAVNLIYFCLVLLFSMCWMHPVCLLISLAGALLYAGSLRGWERMRSSFWLLFPMALLAAVINPAFNHEGITILTYLPSGNPLTLESIFYGLAGAGMLSAVVLWFSCVTTVMTADKWVYLTGRAAPALSLLLSMTLRFVPQFTRQFQIVRETRICAGGGGKRVGALDQFRNLAVVFSVLVTWSLENAIETADSMKGRGYGLPGRTAFSIYDLDSRDKGLLVWFLLCGLFLGSVWLLEGLDWQYYPNMRGAGCSAITAGAWLVYLALCLTPVILQRREERLWNLLQSKI